MIFGNSVYQEEIVNQPLATWASDFISSLGAIIWLAVSIAVGWRAWQAEREWMRLYKERLDPSLTLMDELQEASKTDERYLTRPWLYTLDFYRTVGQNRAAQRRRHNDPVVKAAERRFRRRAWLTVLVVLLLAPLPGILTLLARPWSASP